MTLHAWKHSVLWKIPPRLEGEKEGLLSDTETHNLVEVDSSDLRHLPEMYRSWLWRGKPLGMLVAQLPYYPPSLLLLLLHTQPPLPPALKLAALAAALSLCETANEKEKKVITGWGLITCTVSHSRQPH